MRPEQLIGTTALLSSMAAFLVAMVAGWLAEVPPHCIALRAVIGAAVFWVIGRVVGKKLFSSLCDALSEKLVRNNSDDHTAGDIR